MRQKSDNGNRAADVHCTLVFGKDAYGVDQKAGVPVQLIGKPHGSSGTADPLDQRATVGAKVAAYAAVILNDLWRIHVEHAVPRNKTNGISDIF